MVTVFNAERNTVVMLILYIYYVCIYIYVCVCVCVCASVCVHIRASNSIRITTVLRSALQTVTILVLTHST